MASLDRQTMPQDEFEILFVDDGSPDDTVARIEKLAETRPSIRVLRLANSGWPSKPRNAGMDEACGEYVAFMDHDDELYPDALRAAYDYAVANNADVVNGKEAYTRRPSWALSTYIEDQAQSVGRTDTHPLLPMNPHKLYRLAFLKQHDIRFPEGRRVLWEDQFFNIRAARHAKVISTLSSVPYYHWVESKGGGSDTSFAKWSDDYWSWYRRIWEEIVTQLPGDEHALQREQLMHTQYTARVLGAFDGGYGRRPDEACEFIFSHARALRQDFDLARFDATLTPPLRARAYLLEHGDATTMKLLCSEDTPLRGTAHATSIRWTDGVLKVSADISWLDRDREPLVLDTEDGRIVRRFSDDLLAALPLEVRDWTTYLEGASMNLVVRHRVSRISWAIPVESSIERHQDDDGRVTLTGSVSGSIDPATAAMGNSLTSGYWDLIVGSTLARPVTVDSELPASTLLTGGRLHLVYPNDGGGATIFVDGEQEAVRRLAPTAAQLGDGGELEVLLAGSHDGGGEVPTRVGIDRSLTGTPVFADHPATLVISDGRARLRFTNPGEGCRARIGDKAGDRKPWLPLLTVGDELFYGELPVFPTPPTVAPVKDPLPRTKSTKIRVLLLTNRDSDNVGDQLIEACAISLIEGVMKNLGIGPAGYTIDSRAAGIIPKAYLESGDPTLLKTARTLISQSDIIVFGGAPLFNYTYQRFYLRTIKTLEIAQEHGVPVLFSSIGVEPYDEANSKSQQLKAALAQPVVRQITTRDDISSVEKYAEGTDIAIAHVSDPAVFADIVFSDLAGLSGGSQPSRRRKKRVGLVVTRTGIFKDNGIAFTEADQHRFWADMIAELTARGYNYRLFTTGHFSDEAFLDGLVKAERIPTGKAAVTINSPEELHAQLSVCDGIIAYRLHASIASFAHGIPSVGLSWNFKVPYFYTSVGHGDRALPVERWTAAEVVPALEKAMAEGVQKDEAFLMTVYETLFAGIKNIVAPTSDATPYSYAQLRAELPRYAGTTEEEYRAKVTRKLRRAYDNYRKLERAVDRADERAQQVPAPARAAARAVRTLMRKLPRGSATQRDKH